MKKQQVHRNGHTGANCFLWCCLKRSDAGGQSVPVGKPAFALNGNVKFLDLNGNLFPNHRLQKYRATPLAGQPGTCVM